MSNRTCLLITTYNRSHLLNNTLSRLCHVTPPDEILVIDDGGSDNCEQIVMSYSNRLPVRYIYNHNPEWSICSMARNIGIKNTECDIIITSEPEIVYISDVVRQMLTYHDQVPGKVISAGTIYHMGEKAHLHPEMITSPQSRLSSEPVNNSRDNTNPSNPKGYVKVQGWVAPFTALYRREWLLAIGGWCEKYKSWGFDDTDLLTRLSRNGIQQEIALDIECIHQWHEKLPPNLQYKAAIGNEQLMLSKNFNKEDINNDIIANKDTEWGIIKHR